MPIQSILLSDLINAFLLMVAIVGIFLTYHQIRMNHKIQRATFFKDLYRGFFSDQDIRKIYYQIEYGKFTYGRDFHGTEDEQCLDRLLTFADLVCDLYDQGIITEHEMNFFKYEFKRIYQDKYIKSYLIFLKNFYQQIGTGTEPFFSFVSYCKKQFR